MNNWAKLYPKEKYMEKIVLKHEKEQRTLWFITLVIVFVIGTPFWIVAPFFVGEILIFFGVFLFIWLIIMVLTAIWIPAAFRVLEYAIDDDGVKMSGGVVWKKFVTVPYSKITNVDITRGPLQRLFNIGTIHVQTAGAAGKQGEKAELKLVGIRDLEKVREVIIENIKDLNYPGSGRIKKELLSGGETISKDILNELRNIKDILKEKNN
jgi:membrane protein YdbS with pleckstrin-like domain